MERLTDEQLDYLLNTYQRSAAYHTNMVSMGISQNSELVRATQLVAALTELKELRADAPQIISVEIDYPINSMTDGGK
jgi:hypothetical protein